MDEYISRSYYLLLKTNGNCFRTFLISSNCFSTYPRILPPETHMEPMLIHYGIFLIRPPYRNNQRKIIQNPEITEQI